MREVSLDSIDGKGARVKVIFSVSSVCIVNKNWGITVKAVQLLVKPSTDVSAATVCCFTEVDDDSEVDDDGGNGGREFLDVN
jgi:hypothetical protein